MLGVPDPAERCVACGAAQVFVWYNSGQIWRTDYARIGLPGDGVITEAMSSTADLERAPAPQLTPDLETSDPLPACSVSRSTLKRRASIKAS